MRDRNFLIQISVTLLVTLLHLYYGFTINETVGWPVVIWLILGIINTAILLHFFVLTIKLYLDFKTTEKLRRSPVVIVNILLGFVLNMIVLYPMFILLFTYLMRLVS